MSSRGPAAQVPRPLTLRPGQPAGVNHTTVAQVRADLQGISHAERNWSDEGWRLAVAVGVPGLVVVADLLGHARLDTVRACTSPTEDDRAKTLNLLPADR